MPRRVHARLEEAAELSGTAIGRFMVTAALAKADEVLEREHLIRPSQRDAARLLELLDHPSPPNARLKRALEARRKFTSGGPGWPFELPPWTPVR